MRLNFPFRFIVFTFSTFTLKAFSFACFISVLFAVGSTSIVYFLSAILSAECSVMTGRFIMSRKSFIMQTPPLLFQLHPSLRLLCRMQLSLEHLLDLL